MRRVRPLLWLVLGASAVAGGVVVGVNALADLVRPAELTEVRACAGDAGQDCLARGPATVERETVSRFRWLSGERRWFLDVSAVAPEVREDDRPRVTVPEQPGQDELRDGVELTAVYYRGDPVLLELADGTALETDDHPRRSVPTMGYLALGLLGLGGFAALVGWRNGRRRGWWRRVDYEEPDDGNVCAVLFFAGTAGVITQSVAGTSRWPALVVVLVVGGGLAALLLLAKRRQLAKSRR